jgi:RimJ/RimL family protein N-acetyltransferase
MQEAIPKVIDFSFSNFQLLEINGEVNSQNVKSIALMKKFGFKLKSELENTHLYSFIKK